MTDIADHQLRLTLIKPMQTLDPAIVIAQPSLLAAIKLCITLGGFSTDKQLYMDLDIDAGHWSRILRGDAHFPLDALAKLMDLCGNEAPLIWLVHCRGYDAASLRKRETELETQLRAEREARERAESELRTIKNFLRDTRSAA